MISNLIWVGLGGAAGSMGRYLIGAYAQKWWPGLFPWGTLIANVLGALLIGIFIGLFSRQLLTDSQKLLLMTGFCGGFTTFSTFAQENLSLYQKGEWGTLIIYLTVSMVAGIGAVALGLSLSRS
ncbi:MAG: fluoride efflux transporter CrcB [Bacteroidota bacterium]